MPKIIAKEYKTIRIPSMSWELLRQRANQLAEKRGVNRVSLPDYIDEASKYFEDNHNKQEVSND